jgi:hypothetical protein
MINLPEDYLNNYFNIILFRIKYYLILYPLFTEDNKVINLFKFERTRGKSRIQTFITYNKMTKIYHYNGKRYLQFEQLLNDI